NLGFSSDPKKRFIHDELGWNFRMSNVQAALGVAQMERLPEFIERKRVMGARYQRNFSGIADVQRPLPSTDYADNIYWVFGLVLPEIWATNSAEMQARLGRRGIGTRPFFYPMHLQPVFKSMGWYAGLSLPVSERLYSKGFYIPSGLALAESDIDQISEIVLSELKAAAQGATHET
ncbi:aminotransferase DegT, partial [bacterium]|nr:aminotransferase DegT [bacterium]